MGVVLKVGGGEPIELTPAELVIGREEDCDVTLADDDEVSRHHVSIRLLEDGRAELRDLESRNGTFVDGKQITGTVTLDGGETIRIGQTEITTEAVRPPADETRVSASPPPPPPTQAADVPPPPPAEAPAPTGVPPPTEAVPTPPPPAEPAPTEAVPTPPPPGEPAPTEAIPGPPPTEAVPTPPPPPEPPPTEAVPPPPAPPPPAEPPPPPQPPAPAAREQVPQFVAPPPPPGAKKSGGRRWLWLVLGAILVVLVLAAIWFFLIRETDEDAITSAIEKFGAGDPAACDLITDDLLEETNPGEGSADELRAQCRDEIEPNEGTAEVSNLQITGNRASATITVVGGENDGETEDAVLIKEDGEWKIDSFEDADE